MEGPKSTASFPIKPKKVRYIKLGKKGIWEQECLKKGIIRFSFGSGDPRRFPLCESKRWDDLNNSFTDEGKSRSVSTRFTNETRLFFEDNGSTLWVTFIGERLYWGFLEPDGLRQHADGNDVYRNIVGGWKKIDANGEDLTKAHLSGLLTKLSAYRGTSCSVSAEAADYVICRINGEKTPAIDKAVNTLSEMKNSIQELMKLLQPDDFELLVDLVFSTSGWRRQGKVGKEQKTIDIDLTLPSTGERAFVQVKSETNQKQFEEYIKKIDETGPYVKMFFVYHTGNVEPVEQRDNRVTLIGPEKLANMVIEAGLINWLILKVS